MGKLVLMVEVALQALRLLAVTALPPPHVHVPSSLKCLLIDQSLPTAADLAQLSGCKVRHSNVLIVLVLDKFCLLNVCCCGIPQMLLLADCAITF